MSGGGIHFQPIVKLKWQGEFGTKCHNAGTLVVLLKQDKGY
jgi:hypothetical protein